MRKEKKNEEWRREKTEQETHFHSTMGDRLESRHHLLVLGSRSISLSLESPQDTSQCHWSLSSCRQLLRDWMKVWITEESPHSHKSFPPRLSNSLPALFNSTHSSPPQGLGSKVPGHKQVWRPTSNQDKHLSCLPHGIYRPHAFTRRLYLL